MLLSGPSSLSLAHPQEHYPQSWELLVFAPFPESLLSSFLFALKVTAPFFRTLLPGHLD